MNSVWLARLQQKHRTVPFPKQEPVLPDRFRGAPVFGDCACPAACRACMAACLTDALMATPGGVTCDLGRCLFCGECAAVCPQKKLAFSREYRLSARRRDDLKMTGRWAGKIQALDREARRLFGRSLKLRQVSAGGCNACEADVNVLSTVVFDLGRFGIQFVASPRHADGLLITGPVTRNMESALKKTYAAVPAPKLVIAAGACAISGGPFRDHAEVCNGATGLVPVDLFVAGCPPHPYTILDGLLQLLGRR